MNDNTIKITFPDGYIIIRSVEYFTKQMPLYDVNRVLSYVQECEDELEKLQFFLEVFDHLVYGAKNGSIDRRRFWGVIKKFKKLGFAPGWDAGAVNGFFDRLERENGK